MACKGMASRALLGLAAWLLGWSAAASPQGVDFGWRAADLQRHQRAFSAPRTMYEEANAAFERASQQEDPSAQLQALLDAAVASTWMPADEADVVIGRVKRALAAASGSPVEPGLQADLLVYLGLNLVAAGRLDEAAEVLTRADTLTRSLPDQGHRATLELAQGLLALLRNDAEGALAELSQAYEFAVHDFSRALIMTWRSAITRRASYFYYDLLRTALHMAKESDRLVPPQQYIVLGAVNLSVLTQCEALLGEPDDAERHGREYSKLVRDMASTQRLSYGDLGMARILGQFRRQDIVLAEQLGRRRVLLTWGLLGAGVLAGVAAAAIVMQLRQKRQLRTLSSQLVASNAELEQLGQTHTRLLAATCHDLREPVHALSVLARLAETSYQPGSGGGGGTASTDDYLGSILHCSMKLTDMLSELLDLTRMEGGYYVPQRRVMSLHELFDELQLQFHETARRHGALLEVSDTSLHVRTDPYLLRRIVFSLVRHALDKPEAGLVRVSAVRDRQGDVRLRIQDSAPQAADAIAAMLDRSHELGLSTAQEGVGVGMAVVTRAADLLEVPLDGAFQPGRGNLVSLTLEAAPALRAGPAPASTHDGTGPRQLIAVLEDDDDSRQGLTALLEHRGYDVLAADTAANLAEALRPHGGRRLDLLVTDLHLGGLDGLDEAAMVRNWPGHAHLPVLLLTGDQDAAVSRRTLEANVIVGYKPMLPRQLVARIQEATGQHACGDNSHVAQPA